MCKCIFMLQCNHMTFYPRRYQNKDNISNSPYFISFLTVFKQSLLLPLAIKNNADWPSPSTTLTSPPCFMRYCAILNFPSWRARSSGDLPDSSIQSTSAPDLIKNFTISRSSKPTAVVRADVAESKLLMLMSQQSERH